MNRDTRAEIIQDLEDDELIIRDLAVKAKSKKVRIAYIKLLGLIKRLQQEGRIAS